MSTRPFDDLTEVYEAMIDWPKRLANETPFFRRLFARAGVATLVDAACGAGRHAAMFHSWGLRVEASDLSPAMIARARASFGEPPGLRFTVRSYTEPLSPPEPLDAVVCVGNSLALAPDLAAVELACREMLAAVRPAGLLIVQVLNLWRLPDGPCQWQKIRRATLSGGEVWIAKGVHRCGTRGYVDLVVSDTADAGNHRTESIPFLGIDADDLRRAAQAGGAEPEFLGGYQDQPYDRSGSQDLIMVAVKA